MKRIIGPVLCLSTFAALAKPIPSDERVSQMLEGQRETTSLTQMPTYGKTKLDLWSGHYWPQYQGLLGARYRDSNFSRTLEDEKVQYKTYAALRAATPLYAFAGKEDKLSPAEKYDLLVGDRSMTLTKNSWESGAETAKGSGKVPTWRGICDGFASASQKMPRPTKSVTMSSTEGIPITFFPEDIKALGSLSYARSQDTPAFIGKRCLNAALFFTSACSRTNPGAFHMALTNRVGKLGKSFVADVDPGGEVWNYPVYDYKVTYYNIFSEEESQDFQKVMEPVTKDSKIKNKAGRAKGTAYIVGVMVKVRFKNMRPAVLSSTDSEAQDSYLEKEYDYDLELDRNLNILGGEEFSKNLPDFLWAPVDRTYPQSDEERLSSPRSASEVTAMARLSSAKGQPLSVIVQELFEKSK